MSARLLAAAALVSAPVVGLAHQAGLSHGSYALDGERLEIGIRISSGELAAAWPELAAPPERLREGVPEALVRAVVDTLTAERGVERCAAAGAGALPDAPDGVAFSAEFRCRREGEAVQVRVGFLARMPPGHVHLARSDTGGVVQEQAIDARNDALAIAAGAAPWSHGGRFVSLGIEHIFTGWDHLAFLVGLLLAGGGLGAAVRVVTSFTLGHAVTLALATLGAVNPPSSAIEPLIAASVLYVAVENLRELRGRRGARRRWPVALAFGLVHGFGFAGALAELELPRAGLATALVSFNLGVELGQAAVVAVVFPVLARVRRSPRFVRSGLSVGSTAIAAAGLFWLVERLAG